MSDRDQSSPPAEPGFLEELRRRKVVRVGVAYAAAGWVFLQFADTLIGLLTLPDWTGIAVVGIVVTGFPLALMLTWLFELTPDGVRTTREANLEFGEAQHDESFQSRRNRLALIVGVAVPVLLIGAGLGAGAVWTLLDKPTPSADATPAADMPLIAVVPFRNVSPAEEDDYLAEGVHDEIMARLSGLKGLRVISRDSVVRAAEQGVSHADMVQLMGVTHVVEGSVRRAAERLRISVQLIEATTNHNLWGDRYDGDLTQLFEIQSKVATGIVSGLQTELSPGEVATITDEAPTDIEAYKLFLKAQAIGRSVRRDVYAEQTKQQIDLLQQATAIDPDFAKAWQAIAKNAAGMVHFGHDANDTYLATAQAALARAQALAPGTAGTLAAEAFVLYHGHAQYQSAFDAISRARVLEPGNAEHMLAESYILRRLGRLQEEVPLIREAARLDPLNPRIQRRLVAVLNWNERYEEAYLVALHVASISEPGPHIDDYVERRRIFADPDYEDMSATTESAIAEVNSQLQDSEAEGPGVDIGLAVYLLLEGRVHEARSFFDVVFEGTDTAYDRWVYVSVEAEVFKFLGRDEEAVDAARRALDHLEQHYEESETSEDQMRPYDRAIIAVLAAFVGDLDRAEAARARIREHVDGLDDLWMRQRRNAWYVLATLHVDPAAARSFVVNEGVATLTKSRLADAVYRWYPLLEDARIRARFDDDPAWVAYMRAQWPDTRPFPFDE